MTASVYSPNSAPPAPTLAKGGAAASQRAASILPQHPARSAWHGAPTAQPPSARSPPSPRSRPTPARAGLSRGGGRRPRPRHPADPSLVTLGGNLAQRSRCWYFRDPHIACLKKGGRDCPARSGNHLYTPPSISAPAWRRIPLPWRRRCWPMMLSLTGQRSGLTNVTLWATLPTEHRQCAGVRRNDQRNRTPAPLANERALYKRAISRSHAEWPLVEVCARAVISNGVPVYPHHRRRHRAGAAPLAASEAALQGEPASAATIAKAARQATAGARPLPMTAYKLDLLEGVVRDLLEQVAI